MSTKQKIYLTLLLLTVGRSVLAQNALPEFPGGKDSLNAFIQRNLKFPPRYHSDPNFKDCTVRIRLTVSESGKVEKYFIYQSCLGYDDCDKEALRLMQLMPNWKPATKNGAAAKQTTHVSFEFKKLNK